MRTQQRDGVLWIELDRPSTLNAWDRQLPVDLLAALHAAAAPEVRAVGLRGAGRGFSSGADLKAEADRTPEGFRDSARNLRERFNPVIRAVRNLQKPVVAAVHGPVAGIGCALALSCDLVVAARSASFLLAFVRVGLVPDGGSSLLVPARVGLTRASEMALLGEPIDAERAERWNLVNSVVDDDQLLPTADALLDRLAAGPTGSYAAIKAQLTQAMLPGLEAQMELETVQQQSRAASLEFAEGSRAFAEKRAPRYADAARR